jgi:hypothetical protein
MNRRTILLFSLVSACASHPGIQPANRFDTRVRDTSVAVVVRGSSQALIRFPTPALHNWFLTGPPARVGDDRSRYLWELWLSYSDASPLGISVSVASGNSASVRSVSLLELVSQAQVAALESTNSIAAIVAPLPGVRPRVREASVEVELLDTALVRRLFNHTITEARLTFVDRDTNSHNVQLNVPVTRKP